MSQLLGPRMRRDHRAPILAPNTRSACSRCGRRDHNVRTCTRRLAPEQLIASLIRRGIVQRDATL